MFKNKQKIKKNDFITRSVVAKTKQKKSVAFKYIVLL